MAPAVSGGVPDEIVRPVRRASRFEVGIRKGAQGGSELAVHGTVVGHDRSRGPSAPAFVEDGARLRQTPHDAVEGTVLGLDPLDDGGALVCRIFWSGAMAFPTSP